MQEYLAPREAVRTPRISVLEPRTKGTLSNSHTTEHYTSQYVPIQRLSVPVVRLEREREMERERKRERETV